MKKLRKSETQETTGARTNRSHARPASTPRAGDTSTSANPIAGLGKPGPLPHRAQMERAFGVSFESVSARTEAKLDRFNASAASASNHVAFHDRQPAPDQVAHELTHVLQQRGGDSSHGVSSPGQAAEREATHNAERVRAGQNPMSPQVGASAGVVYRDIKEDIRVTIDRWGTDEETLFNRLSTATPDEIELVSSDPVLMRDIQDDLDREDWGKVLGFLGIGLETRIYTATTGWGTDEEGIYNALDASPAATLQELMSNGVLLIEFEDELNDSELGKAMAIVADKFQKDGTIPAGDILHVLTLFPDSIEDASDTFDGERGNHVINNVITQLPRGSAMTAEQLSDANVFIANVDGLARVLAMFQQRWNFSMGTAAPAVCVGPAWTVDKLRTLHNSLQEVPAAHVAHPANQNLSGFRQDAARPNAGAWSDPCILIGTERTSGVSDLVRHEVGHAMDDYLNANFASASDNFKKNATNGWDWSAAVDLWESSMANPWLRSDGTQVPAADQAAIKTQLNSYVTVSSGSQDLDDFVPAGHAVLTYWNDNVPMVEAAKSIAGYEDKVYNHTGRIKKFSGVYYSFSVYYNEFYVYNAVVQDKRVSNYSLFGHPEFFAELYEAYYKDGPGAKRGEALAGVPNWKNFFDTVVHPTV